MATARPAAVAALGGLAGWLFVHCGVAVVGLTSGLLSPFAIVAVIADPGLGIGAAVLTSRLGPVVTIP